MKLVHPLLSTFMLSTLISGLAAEEIELRPGGKQIDGPPPTFLFAKDGLRVSSLGPRERAVLEEVRRANGGAGAVTNLVTVQFLFSDPANGNGVALLFDITEPNEQTAIFINGDLIGAIPGDLDSISVAGVPAGTHEFAVLGVVGGAPAGDPSIAMQDVVNEQPFRSIVRKRCTDGQTTAGECALAATWEAPEPRPTFRLLFLNGGLLTPDGFPPEAEGVVIGPIEPGAYSLDVLGFLLEGSPGNSLLGTFQGAPRSFRCTITCGAEATPVPAMNWRGVAAAVALGLGAGFLILRRRQRPAAEAA